MADPQIDFVGSALVESGGAILPLEFNSPHLLVWVFRGEVPAQNWHIGWIQPIIDTDLGQNVGDQIQNLYIGQRKIAFDISPFKPPYRIQIIPKSWILQLECQFYQVIEAETNPLPNDSSSGSGETNILPIF